MSLAHAFQSRKLFTVLMLGFASGLPLALTGATLQAWMKSENVDLAVIGLFSLVGLPYALKFIWAPLMDRYAPPVFTRFGRRRGWMLWTQMGLFLSIALMALVNPGTFPQEAAALALVVSFLSASQDIVLDAYRTDILTEAERGPGAALHITGYRVAMLVSGSLALILADQFAWPVVYGLMALTMLTGLVATFIAPESATPPETPRSLHEAVILPFREYFKRKGAWETLVFIVMYRIDVVMATALLTPFLLDLGFTKTDIGAVSKGFGFAATIAGTLFGGGLMVKLGLRRSLWIFGIAQGLSTLTFWWLSHVGYHYPTMVAAIAIENFCSGMGTAAFSAFIMSLCDRRYSATQYALLTSLMALTRVIGGAPTGYLAKAVGWENFFLIATLSMIPGVLLLLRFREWTLPKFDGDVGAKSS